MTAWSTVPKERKSLHHFYMFVFLGFTSLLLVYLNMLCLYRRDTKLELCFIYLLHNEPKFLLVKKVVGVVQRLQCILYASLTFQKLPNQSQFMLSLPLYLQSIHNKEFQRNLHTAGSCSSQTAPTSDGFQPISSCLVPVLG